MHELSVTQIIFDIVHKHAIRNDVQKVKTVNLEIGALSDLQDEWIQHYFDYISKDSIVEGARIKVSRIPAIFRCRTCDEEFKIMSLLNEKLICRTCNTSDVIFVSGREYTVKNMEVL